MAHLVRITWDSGPYVHSVSFDPERPSPWDDIYPITDEEFAEWTEVEKSLQEIEDRRDKLIEKAESRRSLRPVENSLIVNQWVGLIKLA